MPPVPPVRQPDADDVRHAAQRLIRQLADLAGSVRTCGPSVNAVALGGLRDLAGRVAKLRDKVEASKTRRTRSDTVTPDGVSPEDSS